MKLLEGQVPNQSYWRRGQFPLPLLRGSTTPEKEMKMKKMFVFKNIVPYYSILVEYEKKYLEKSQYSWEDYLQAIIPKLPWTKLSHPKIITNTTLD